MFEFETSMSRPTAYELHRRARREQSEAVNALARGVARKLTQWVGTLAGSGIKLTGTLAAEWRLRRDIRTLRQLGDLALRDMGLTRGEIEHVVRHGRRWHAMDWAGYVAPARVMQRGGPGKDSNLQPDRYERAWPLTDPTKSIPKHSFGDVRSGSEPLYHWRNIGDDTPALDVSSPYEHS